MKPKVTRSEFRRQLSYDREYLRMIENVELHKRKFIKGTAALGINSLSALACYGIGNSIGGPIGGWIGVGLNAFAIVQNSLVILISSTGYLIGKISMKVEEHSVKKIIQNTKLEELI